MPDPAINNDSLPEKNPAEDAAPEQDDPEVIVAEAKKAEAEAKKINAQATLARAQQPLLDRIIIRGLIPLALLVAGPLATYMFQTEWSEQSRLVTDLKKIVEDRQEENDKWRERMRKLESEKAAELAAMGAMVTRLAETQRIALIQMAVMQSLRTMEQPKSGTMPPQRAVLRDREEVIQDVSAQMQLPGFDMQEVELEAGRAYDRYMEQRARKGGK